MAGTLDGFELSRIDLEQRREGDVLGAAQSGVKSSLRLLSVLEDEEIIAEARDEAARLVADDPDLTDHPALAAALRALVDDDRRPPLAVLDVADELSKGPLSGLRVEVLHGRMQPDAKDDVMRQPRILAASFR